MASQKQQEISSEPSEISKFYDGKSIFITGAAGFLGTVLLETLLRCCSGISRIYILLRSKKGMESAERKEEIFKKEIFWKIREKYPDVLNKVVVISGDISQDNLGMSSEDLHKVSQEVSIVFHCAAAISFLKPLSFMVQQNVIGTINVIEFCRKLKKLDAFVYTSTAYSNSNYMEIEEKIYKLPFTVEEALTALKSGSEEEMMSLFSKCEPKFPNFYTFSKCVTETLIAEKASDLPACVVRPSIIICCLKGVQPGYIENGSGLTMICLGVGKGFIRVLYCDPEMKVNHIPVDVVANTHIIAAYRQSADNMPSPFIYNCVATKPWTWFCLSKKLLEMSLKHPLPNRFQIPTLTLCKSSVKYWIFSILDHYAPAIVIDSLLWLSGRKTRLLKLYQFYDGNIQILKPFIMNQWTFRYENFQSIADKLNATDKELFSTDLTGYTLNEITRILPTGAPLYKKNSDKSNEKWTRPKYLPLYLISFIKWSVLGGLASALYAVLF